MPLPAFNRVLVNPILITDNDDDDDDVVDDDVDRRCVLVACTVHTVHVVELLMLGSWIASWWIFAVRNPRHEDSRSTDRLEEKATMR